MTITERRMTPAEVAALEAERGQAIEELEALLADTRARMARRYANPIVYACCGKVEHEYPGPDKPPHWLAPEKKWVCHACWERQDPHRHNRANTVGTAWQLRMF